MALKLALKWKFIRNLEENFGNNSWAEKSEFFSAKM